MTLAGADEVEVNRSAGFESWVIRDLPPGEVVDARGAEFRLSNSRNVDPNETFGCDYGPLPVSRYPLRIENSPEAVLLGGRVNGDVPLRSDWIYTYCNSAVVSVAESVGAQVRGLRARRLWDGVRFGSGSPSFVLEEAWLSDVRDDCVENDFLHSGRIRNVLFDGCFVGISVKLPSDRTGDGSGETVTLERVLMRLQPYLYKGELAQGPPIKADEASPAFAVRDSVIALSDEHPVSRSQFEAGWAKISDCSGNLLLWLSDAPWPKALGEPPSCFQLVLGERARALWQKLRGNWIDCHPAADRFDDDPASEPSACDMRDYGGLF